VTFALADILSCRASTGRPSEAVKVGWLKRGKSEQKVGNVKHG